MSRRIVILTLCVCSVAMAQKIYVSPWNMTPYPTSCSVTPYSFQIPFNFYVDTYDPCGNLSQDTYFPMTGTGYCSGHLSFCTVIANGTTKVAPITGSYVAGGTTVWYVTGQTGNVTSGLLYGYGCGGEQIAANGPNVYPVPNSCPSKCSGHTSPPNCIAGCPCGGSPIVVDAKGEGFHLTSLEGGIKFRDRGNTPQHQFAWTDPRFSNGWLTLPKNGEVRSLDELFGNFTP